MRTTVLFSMLLCCNAALGQDTTGRGTIHIGGQKADTSIRVYARFQYQLPGRKIRAKSYEDAVFALSSLAPASGTRIVAPSAAGIKDFNFEKYFSSSIRKPDLPASISSDTIVLKIVVLDDGRYFYKTETAERLKADVNLQKAQLALHEITGWIPASNEILVKKKFKGATVIVPEKHFLHAIGVITIIFNRER